MKFKITKEELWNLFLEQDKKCALSGWDLIMLKDGRTASLDRIDSKKGYVIDNLRWIHRDINLFKSTMNNEYFLYLCKIISDNNQNIVERQFFPDELNMKSKMLYKYIGNSHLYVKE